MAKKSLYIYELSSDGQITRTVWQDITVMKKYGKVLNRIDKYGREKSRSDLVYAAEHNKGIYVDKIGQYQIYGNYCTYYNYQDDVDLERLTESAIKALTEQIEALDNKRQAIQKSIQAVKQAKESENL